MSVKFVTNIPLEDAEFTIVDVETTGTNASRNSVIEVGMVKIRGLEIAENFRTFINPACPIPYYISQLTGIYNSDVAAAPYFDEAAISIKEFLADSVFTAHNLQFDLGFIKSEFNRAEIDLPVTPGLCTLKLSRRIFPELPSKSLGSVTRHLQILHKNAHRALGDATVTAKLLLRIIKILKLEYNIQTLNELLDFQKTPASQAKTKKVKKGFAEGIANAPDEPGVYFFKNASGIIYYIGKAKSLEKRIKSYFRGDPERKTKKIFRASSQIEFLITNTELTALLTEASLIKQYNPEINRQLKKYPENYFIRISLEENFPRLEPSGEIRFDEALYYGPYNNRESSANIRDIIDHTFRLRECTEKEFSGHKKCYLLDIERCLAPCINPDIAAYSAEMEKVYEFLSGKNQAALKHLLDKMKKFSDLQRYEEAAEVKDITARVLDLISKTALIKEPVNKANILLEVFGTKRNDYILLLGGKVFVKNPAYLQSGSYEEALKDYFENTINVNSFPGSKDLESIKIILSWLIRNPGKYKMYYLNEFDSERSLLFKIHTRT